VVGWLTPSLASDTFLGLGGEEHAIPWGKPDYDPPFCGFRTDITEEQLRGAPTFYGERDYDGVWIAYGDDRTLVPCTLLDVSHSGARLMLPGNEDVPDNLVLLHSEHGRARRQCRVAWRRKDKVGVEFVVVEDKRPAAPRH
jgi:hypothetical protein